MATKKQPSGTEIRDEAGLPLDPFAELEDDTDEGGLRIYIKLPEQLSPTERYTKYEEPLDAALEEADLGQVTGGGAMLSDSEIEYCGIDVNGTGNIGEVVALLRRVLRVSGAPRDATIEVRSESAPQPFLVWDDRIPNA